jgi:hypothetical protein
MAEKGVVPDYKPSIPFTPLKEKEIEIGEKPIAVKLQHAVDGSDIPNPTTVRKDSHRRHCLR